MITLLSRPGCHLCDDARAVISRVAADLGIAWTERDITASADDVMEYGEMIPVTLIDGDFVQTFTRAYGRKREPETAGP